jgi:hypothetical protein
MPQDPMRRLPQTYVWQNVEGMIDDLETQADLLSTLRKERNTDEYIRCIVIIRTLAEEILRWELL